MTDKNHSTLPVDPVSGAETCSRASMEPSSTVSTLTGFDQGEGLWPSISAALKDTPPAKAIGILSNHILALAPQAGLYVGISIKPAGDKA